MGNPDSLGFTATDKVLHATLRLNWHLVIFSGSLLTSPITRGMVLEIGTQLTKADTEALLALQPYVVLWIALSAGPFALNLQAWSHTLLRAATIAAGHPSFKEAVRVFEQDYLWHPNRNGQAERFWHRTSAELSVLQACCRTSIAAKPSEEEIEQDLTTAFETLEFGGKAFAWLEPQYRKSRRCLCAWWV